MRAGTFTRKLRKGTSSSFAVNRGGLGPVLLDPVAPRTHERSEFVQADLVGFNRRGQHRRSASGAVWSLRVQIVHCRIYLAGGGKLLTGGLRSADEIHRRARISPADFSAFVLFETGGMDLARSRASSPSQLRVSAGLWALFINELRRKT